MTEDKKYNWNADHLRDQIDEIFRAGDDGDKPPGLAQEVWEACHRAGAWAATRVHGGLGEVIKGSDNLPTSAGTRHEIMGLLPGAQYLMATVGVAGALLDSIMAAMHQESAAEDGGSFGAKKALDKAELSAAVQATIQEIHAHTAEQITQGIAELFPDQEEE